MKRLLTFARWKVAWWRWFWSYPKWNPKIDKASRDIQFERWEASEPDRGEYL